MCALPFFFPLPFSTRRPEMERERLGPIVVDSVYAGSPKRCTLLQLEPLVAERRLDIALLTRAGRSRESGPDSR